MRGPAVSGMALGVTFVVIACGGGHSFHINVITMVHDYNDGVRPFRWCLRCVKPCCLRRLVQAGRGALLLLCKHDTLGGGDCQYRTAQVYRPFPLCKLMLSL